jgi:hypothetical protein
LSSIFTEPDPPQPFDAGDSLLERHGGHVTSVEISGFLEAARDAENTLDHGA